jgi:hypothetical protein
METALLPIKSPTRNGGHESKGPVSVQGKTGLPDQKEEAQKQGQWGKGKVENLSQYLQGNADLFFVLQCKQKTRNDSVEVALNC